MPTGFIRLTAIAIAFASVSFAQIADYTPITPSERVHWLLKVNFSPASLLVDVAHGAEDTLLDSSKEYGRHWDGFAKRVGIVTANYGVKTTIEAGLGSIWGEDPRYDRTEGQPFGSRLGHVVKMTFLARNRNGDMMPAYARMIAIPGSNFLANAWMTDSEATVNAAAARTGMGFLTRMAENAYKEFRPRHR